MLPDAVQLKQLRAVAAVLLENASKFVSCKHLLQVARDVCTDNGVGWTRNLRDDCSKLSAGSQLKPWLMRNLYPALQTFVMKPESKSTTALRVFFYASPRTAEEHSNLKQSYVEVIDAQASLNIHSVLRSVNIQGHMQLLPDESARRVFRSLVARVAQSNSFLEEKINISAKAGANAVQKVDAALRLSVLFESRDSLDEAPPQHLQVSNNMTMTNQHQAAIKARRKLLLQPLLDEHFGGRTSLKDHCLKLGLCLQNLMEVGTAELGNFHYAGEGVGENLVNKQRNSETVMRACTWTALADYVQEKVQAEEEANGLTVLTTVAEGTMRRYAVQRWAKSITARRADPIAAVSHQKLKAAAGEFHVDARSGHALVRQYAEAFAELADLGVVAIHRDWDDHSKIESDKRRAFTQNRTLLLRREVKTAPHSDMGKVLGGAKVIVNSILCVLPPQAEGWQDGVPRANKREHDVVKQGYAVCRLESERRSTPAQQLNDWHLVQKSDKRLGQYMESCTVLFSLSDSGWDHDQRNTEVRFWLTWDHLHSNRNYDVNFVRPAELSAYNEAERLNGVETRALARGHCPSLLALGRPKNAGELARNRLAFLHSIANAIGTAKYAGRNLVSLPSHSEVPDSMLHSDAERKAIRGILDTKAGGDRNGMPYTKSAMPTLTYQKLHSLAGHYDFQLRREACTHELGRLCRRSDYGRYAASMDFLPCDEREWRGAPLPFVFMPSPERSPNGSFEYWPTTKSKIQSGEIPPVPSKLPPPSVQLKAYFKHSTPNPSPSEVQRLAAEVMKFDGDVPVVEEWFSVWRMKQFERDEELKVRAREAELATIDESNVLEVVDRIVFMCASKVPGMVKKAKLKANYVFLLKDGSVDLNDRGTLMELVERLYFHRDHLLSMFNLDPLEVYPSATRTAHAEVEDIECEVCKSKSYSSENPIILCDGKHGESDCGYHIHCLTPPLGYVPEGDWLCPHCVAEGNHVMLAVIGKKKFADQIYYQVLWQGHEEPSWQAFAEIPHGSRDLVNRYNRTNKRLGQL